MHKLNIIILIAALCYMHPAPAAAQLAGLEKGDKIRVTTSKQLTGKKTGIVSGITRDSLYFLHCDSSIRVSIASIKKLEISTGQRSNAGRGALIGAGTLGFTFAVIAMSTDTDCRNTEGFCMDLFTRKEAFFGGFLAGALVGGATGAIIGHFTIRDRWEQIELSPVTLVSHTNHRLAAVGIRIRF